MWLQGDRKDQQNERMPLPAELNEFCQNYVRCVPTHISFLQDAQVGASRGQAYLQG
jgi:hypothetical protein